MIESYVDLQYRGLALARRVKLTSVRPREGYVEMPGPMPVGTLLTLSTDEGVTIDAKVIGVTEQTGGVNGTPGIQIAPVLDGAAKSWWAARVALPDAPPIPKRMIIQASASGGTVSPVAAVPPSPNPSPEASSSPSPEATAAPAFAALAAAAAAMEPAGPGSEPRMSTRMSAQIPAADSMEAAVAAAAESAAAAAAAATAAAQDAIPAPPPSDEDTSEAYDVTILPATDGAPEEVEDSRHEKRTRVMEAVVAEELLQQLSAADSNPRMTSIVDDGRQTQVMDVVDLSALGLDSSASGSLRMSTDDVPEETSDDKSKPTAGGKKKRKKRGPV